VQKIVYRTVNFPASVLNVLCHVIRHKATKIKSKCLGAQSLFKSCYLLIYLGNSAHLMIHEVSLPCSQQPASGPFSEPNESIMCLPVLFI